MWLPSNGDGLVQVRGCQVAQRLEQTGPALVPVIENLLAAGEGVDEFAIPIAAGLFAIRRQKIGPPREQITCHMFHDDRDGVGVGIKRQSQLLIGQLLHGPFCESPIGFEGIDDGREKLDGSIHVRIIGRPAINQFVSA